MNSTTIIKLIFLLILFINFTSCNGEPKPQCDIPQNITYNDQVASLIEIHCFKCHAQDVYKEKASRHKIFDYTNLKKSGESGQLIGSITHAQGFIPMPYRKGVKIDSCAIEVIKKWVELGMQE
ncbi:hypothetical protein D1818_23090 [Aquimarina sp. BL5]|uniref:hypothetical protein n=1 Tax=Aquimarina sp. BL5 TaxID=1714860 RepID=UPI000E4DD9BC|nr:hypothetical protein [Aquimarina sp. BL5]AXT53568.1 hypothetical protein D1818_23090 [Aquimarina sp. BL5]RKN01580.1 hypothetical protein D7036_17550 [Aquimarina sp. BL5]